MKLNKIFGTLMLFISCSLSAVADEARQIAFPGAEGFGRYTSGGRGGTVYHVTTLEDNNNAGSLRYAVNQKGKRIIVFDIGGTITLKSTLSLKNGDITIAGQTAPGDGICVTGYPFQINANNVIIRYMRFRVGNENVTINGADGWDGLGSLDQKNIIVDHCSVSWSIDECCSFSGCSNITLQWSLVSQSLVNAGHGKGAHGYGGNWGGSGASYHHNLLAHHGSRTPRLGPRPTTQKDERMDMRNNVIYNFGGNGCYGGEGMKVNIVNNYYQPGPGSPSGNKAKRIAGIGIRTREYCHDENGNPNAYYPMMHVWGKYYVNGNANSQHADVTKDNWTYGMYNQIDASGNDGTYTAKTKDTIKLDSPIPFEPVTTHTVWKTYNKVLDFAGASLKRDALDAIMVSDTKTGKASFTGDGNGKGFINSQKDIVYSDGSVGLPKLANGTPETDSDGDGMPDAWETANGLNPNDKADGSIYSLDKFGYYTNVEIYINSIVESISKTQNSDAETTVADEYYPEWKSVDGTVHNPGSVAPNGAIEHDTPSEPSTPGDDTEEPSTPTDETVFAANPDGLESIPAGTVLVNNQYFKATTVYDATGGNSNYNYSDGEAFESWVQMRVAQNPSADAPYGAEQSDCTPIVIETKQAIKLSAHVRTGPNKEAVMFDAETFEKLSSTSKFLEESEKNSLWTWTWELANSKKYVLVEKGGTGRLSGFTVSTTNGIEGINADNNKKGVMYNLSGQKVNSTYKGIVIMNGKKFLLK